MLSESEIRSRVVELFKNSGLTQAEAAAKAEVQPSTLSRYLAGDSKNPQFMSLCGLITSLGGSVDQIIGNSSDGEELSAPQKEIVIRTDEKYVEVLREDLHRSRRIIQILAVALAAVVVFLVGFLIFDLLHPEIGFFQYGEDIARYYAQDEVYSSALSVFHHG